MKDDDEETDIYEAFNKETGLFMVPEDGLYMIIVGDFKSYCEYTYVVGESTTKHFNQGQSTSNTQWLASGTKLQVYTSYTPTQFNTYFNIMFFTESALRPIQSVSRDVRLCVCVSVRHTLETTLPEGLESSGRRAYR